MKKKKAKIKQRAGEPFKKLKGKQSPQVSSEAIDRSEQYYMEGLSALVKCSKCGDDTAWTLNGECMTCVKGMNSNGKQDVIKNDAGD